MENPPIAQDCIDLGILLLVTKVAILFHGVDSVPKKNLELLHKKRLIVSPEVFRLTRLGERVIFQAQKDSYTYKWPTKK